VCDPAAGPPSDGDVRWTQGSRAVISDPQAHGWVTVSADGDCASIAPRSPPSQVSWEGPDAKQAFCDPPILDGQGNLSVLSLSTHLAIDFLPADGAAGAEIVEEGNTQIPGVMTGRDSGFVLETTVLVPCTPSSCSICEWGHLLEPDGAAGKPIFIDAPDTGNFVWRITPNPLGGYVEARTANVCRGAAHSGALELRWVDDGLQPTGDWQRVTEWRGNNDWVLLIDRRGNALVLSFIYPPGAGAAAPPSTWTFRARWLARNGPLTDEFTPVAPVFTRSSGSPLFATFGRPVPLEEGGFAMYESQASPDSGGTVSPAGWYALYRSGQAAIMTAPEWLKPFDGSLRWLWRQEGYAAIQKDPTTCARTVELISRSGRVCSTLRVEGSARCDLQDSIEPDGTLLLRHNCDLHWWPRLAHPQ
jgi:hypothetical protein